MINNVILDLENKSFKESERLEEFLAIKWTIAALRLIVANVDNEYKSVVNQQYTAPKSDNTWMEELPDNTPL